ncbi:TlpA disulfide reductase family protein [Psychrobium sp. 1_MG-2023]|uniref:TlpA disulfide reductase family protein n=1 Tax=Psychrobium sp. 1_MG-2023 TaxID=3062624 RepID=UPI0027355C7D|nr:TlpA disulfide reductase family protein [Psychrobium sp. 1_MG-2023]MDP2562861.1 TlpA disulfide reductase family protein [Psychrobium sp. 1_MG-2023]
MFKIVTQLMAALMVLMVSAANASEEKTMAQDFTLKSLSGENLRLQEMRGDVILVNFWATWCGPCRKEMPYLDELHQEFADLGFSVLGVNVEQDSNLATDFINELEVSFPVLFDNKQQVSELYKVDAMPMTVMIDRNGYQRVLHRGYVDGDEEIYRKIIKELIRE